MNWSGSLSVRNINLNLYIKSLVFKVNKSYLEKTMKEERVGLKESRYQGFYESLKTTIDLYEGKYKELVKYCPPFFRLLCEIVNDKLTDWNTKLMIDAALAYFVLPEDIIPDHKEQGYVDDLFIVCHVLKEIKSISPKVIEDNWQGEEKILPLIDSLYEKSGAVVAEYSLEILRKVGLHKYQSLDLVEYSGEYPQKIARIANEKRELLALLAYLIKVIHKVNVRGWKVEAIKELLESYGDYDEINRLIELSKMNHEYTPIRKLQKESQTIEEKLRQARMKVLMEENTGD